MSGSALVLAAHGSHVEPSTNELVREYAKQLFRLGLFDEVTAAFHQGEPVFATVLDGLSADDITVVPLMSSRGYYSEVVLLRELARNERYTQVHLRQTVPVGAHPGMVSLVARRVRERLRENNLQSSATSLAVVGHGTERHRRSRDATIALVDDLRELALCREVLPAFLDEPPYVGTILERATQPNVVVVPFLISDGPHATRDIPAGLGLTLTGDPPITGQVGDRFVVCDAAVGTDRRIIKIVTELAVGPLEDQR